VLLWGKLTPSQTDPIQWVCQITYQLKNEQKEEVDPSQKTFSLNSYSNSQKTINLKQHYISEIASCTTSVSS